MMMHRLLPLVGAILLVSSPCMAMQALDNSALSQISGRDGITLNLAVPKKGIYVQKQQVQVGAGTSAAELDFGTTIDANGNSVPMKLLSVGPDGKPDKKVANIKQTLDFGQSTAGNPLMSYRLDLHGAADADGGHRGRLLLGEASVGTSKAYGTLALDGEGVIALTNEGGLFNATSQKATLFGELTHGRLYYRQLDGNDEDRATFINDNLTARWIYTGTYGITDQGLKMATAPGTQMQIALDADYFYKSGGTDLTAGGRGLRHFGFLGNVNDATLLWRFKNATAALPVATADNPYPVAATPGVLNISARWNFVNADNAASYKDIWRWRLGETAGKPEYDPDNPTGTLANGDTRTLFEASDWAVWGANEFPKRKAFDFPIVALDLIDGAGVRTSNGLQTAGLCWGARANNPDCSGFNGTLMQLKPGYINASSGHKGLALMIRNGNQMSYSRSINLLVQQWDAATHEWKTRHLNPGDPYYDANTTANISWGLIYTFANANANIWLYPGGSPFDADKGITADVLLMSQSFAPDKVADVGTSGAPGDYNRQGFNWDTGSQLMIADTDVNGDGTLGKTRDAMGIGLIGTSFGIMLDDARIWLNPMTNNDYYSEGLSVYVPRSRVAINTTFGGGILPDSSGNYGAGPRFVRGAIIKTNVEGQVAARFSPSAPNTTTAYNAADVSAPFNADGSPQNYLGYAWAFNLKDLADDAGSKGFGNSPYGSYLSFAEPSNPAASFRYEHVTGAFTYSHGKIDLKTVEERTGKAPGSDCVSGQCRPALDISHIVKFGRAAAKQINSTNMFVGHTVTAAPFKIGAVTLSGQKLMKVVIPSGKAFARIRLEPQGVAGHVPSIQ